MMETFKQAKERYDAERIRDERLIRIEAKLDRILTNDLATNQELLQAASGGVMGFDEVLKAWVVTSD